MYISPLDYLYKLNLSVKFPKRIQPTGKVSGYFVVNDKQPLVNTLDLHI